MATLDQYATGTLSDVLKGKVNGERLHQIMVLQKATPIMKDLKVVEANDGDIMTTEVQNSLITTTSREYNEYKSAGKSTSRIEKATAQNFGTAYSIDARILAKEKNEKEFLSRQIDGMLMSMGQSVDQAIIYGNGIGDKMLGLSARLSDLTNDRVISAGGSSDCTSMYVICHDASNGAWGFYPEGSNGSLQVKDLGNIQYTDPSGDKRLEKRDLDGEFDFGFCVGDDRALGRIANIDVGSTSSSTFDEEDVIDIMNHLPIMLRSVAMGYVSRNLMAAIEKRANAKTNAYYTAKNVYGETLTAVRDLPIRLDEMISEDETVVA